MNRFILGSVLPLLTLLTHAQASPSIGSNAQCINGSGVTVPCGSSSNPISSSMLSRTLFTVQQQTVGTTYYVSNAGSDSNDGKTLSTPFLTLAKVNSLTLNPGDQVLLRRGDVWHERLNLAATGTPSSPIRVADYGSANLSSPSIDGADPVTNWTVSSGNVYKAPYTLTAVKLYVDALYTETAPLTLASSAANVASTPGSFYSDGTNLYVQLLAGDNPANHTIEVAALSDPRNYGIFSTSSVYLTVENLRIFRTAKSGAVFYQGSDNSGSNRTQNEYITFRNNVTFNTGNTQGDAFLGGQGALFVHARNISGQLGLRGWVVTGNSVGRMGNTPGLDYNTAGIQMYGTIGAVVSANSVATTNAMGIQLRDPSSNQGIGTGTILGNNVLTNNQGNISAEEPYSISTSETVNNSFGFCEQLGSHSRDYALSCTNMSTSSDGALYNGVDENGAVDVAFINPRFLAINGGCAIDFENGSTGYNVSGAVVVGAGGNGCLVNLTNNSLTGSVMSGNIYSELAGVTNGFHIGGSGSNAGTNHTRAEFQSIAPNAGGDVSFLMTPPATDTKISTALANLPLGNYSDAFNYTGALPSTWTVTSGAFNAATAGTLSPNGSAQDVAYFNGNFNPAQQSCVVAGTISNNGDRIMGAVRVSQAGGYFTFSSAANGIQLFAGYLNGGGSQVANTPTQPTANHEICTSISATNEIVITDTTTNTILIDYTLQSSDPLFSSGAPGVNSYGTGTNTITNWRGGNISNLYTKDTVTGKNCLIQVTNGALATSCN